MDNAPTVPDNAAVAIIGMAGRFPGARNVAEFWRNLVNGMHAIRFFSDAELLAAGVTPDLLQNPHYVKAGTVLEQFDHFDAPFFGFTPREAEIMDPQSRLLLECAWEALSQAGYEPGTFDRPVGIFAGKRFPWYMIYNLGSNPDLIERVGSLQVGLSNQNDSLATLIAYKLDLKGPGVNVQTYCSTSLVAVHLACQSLLAYECDMALAGGAAVQIPQGHGYLYQEGGIASPDGFCRTFDARGQGSVFGDGVGLVVLKRLDEALADGDHIFALICGSALNNDGMQRVGYTAPGLNGQAAVIAEALGSAGVAADSISYIEAHGTGTPLGDSVELEAMNRAFRHSTQRTHFCAIGSVKPNVGHLDRAAGVTGLIKTALALEHEVLPPTLNFERPNPDFDWQNSPFYVNTELKAWRTNGSGPRRAGVSSFGLGGTNVHVVLQEAPPSLSTTPSRPYHLLPLSAKTEAALAQATTNLAAHLRAHPDLNLADVAYTLQVGRAAYNHRRFVLCQTLAEAVNAFEPDVETAVPTAVTHLPIFTSHDVQPERPVVFLFPGVGDHYPGMGQALYQTEPVFREWVDRCCQLLQPYLGLDLRQHLFPTASEPENPATLDLRRMLARPSPHTPLHRTALAQPAVFVIEYALAQLLFSWGIRPQAMMGYSLGEYVAACLAGVFSLDDALALVARRAALIETLDTGVMLAVSAPAAAVQPFLKGEAALAADINPNTVVLSGPVAAIEQVAAQLEAQAIACRRLPTSHAFHSPMMQPVDAALTTYLEDIALSPPQIPLISNVTGDWLTAVQATSPDYWAQHLCQTVRFGDGLATLLAQPTGILEVGPGQSLASFVKQHPAVSGGQRQMVWSTLPYVYESQPADAFLLRALGQMWLAGVEVDWVAYYQHERRQRVPLPSHPFIGQRYWVAARQAAVNKQPSPLAVNSRKPDISDWFYQPIWQKTAFPTGGKTSDSWLIFCDTAGLGDALGAQCPGQVLTVRAGDSFVDRGHGQFTIRPDAPEDYVALCQALRTQKQIPQTVIHLWSTGLAAETAVGPARFAAARRIGFDSLVYGLQALSREKIRQPMEMVIVSSNAQPVTGTELFYPERTAVFGVCRAIVQECSTLTCRAIDLDADEAVADQARYLLAELDTPLTHLEVAYRQGERYERTYQPAPLAAGTPLLRPQGTYFITGGLGGVGLILAEHLARVYGARLALIGRSALPAPETWDVWLETHPESDHISRKIRQVQVLEALGAEVLLIQADVADVAQMTTAVTQTVAHFGPIHGVIHAAGISDLHAFNSVEQITPAQCDLHFWPKVQGLYALDAALAGQQPDFCLLFSSLSSVLGGLGFVAYTAANTFMDAFAHQKSRQETGVRWLSVNWDTWRVRTGANEVVGKTVAAFEITPAEGVAAFERVLSHNVGPQLVHSTGELDARLQQWLRLDKARGDGPKPALAATAVRPPLPTAYTAATDEIERQVMAVWQELLGIEQIGIDDNFFDLGGNSLIGITLIARLKEIFDAPIPVTALFEAPTINALARYLRPAPEAGAARPQTNRLAARRKQAAQTVGTQSIAIVGMSGRFPGAPTIDQLWCNLRDGKEAVTSFTAEELIAAGVSPAEVNHPQYVRARPILADADLFDAAFFGFNPREAELTDPQHRLFLECAWEAMEQAGYEPKNYPGLVGVYGGMGLSFYLLGMARDPEFLRSLGAYEASYQLAVGNDKDSLTTAVSYKLNLKGPSFSVQTFCSTSLVAVHLACQSLLTGECDMALAGGVSVRVPVKSGYLAAEGGMESPDGHCRTFDARAAGTMFGDGVGVVLLKRLDDALEDGDTIYACIKGSAINNDGSLKVGYAAPSVEGQAEVITAALEKAGVTADTIDYIEAHGTATPLGDPIEVAALTRAFRRTTQTTGYCAIGSIKTNIGHVDRAAGISGLIKTALALHHEQIPPSLHFESPNPEIDFASSPFFVNTRLLPWQRNGHPRRAGVSSLGMGGTNVHVVLEEAPVPTPPPPARPDHLLLLSARSETALAQMTANLAAWLRQNPTANLADVAYTLQVGRTRFSHRRAIVCREREELLPLLAAPDSAGVLTHFEEREDRPVAFLFPGVGDHYVNMAHDLYQHEPEFQETVDWCLAYLVANEGLELAPVLYPPDKRPSPGANGHKPDLRQLLARSAPEASLGRLAETAVAQPAVFVVEYALARLLLSWGIQPGAMIGYSLGEYVAACLAGVLSPEEALTLVARRAKLIQALPRGAMLAISLPADAVSSYLNSELSLAAVNGPQMCVLAGSETAVQSLAERLEMQGIACRRLPTSHAFHSYMMAPIAADLTALVASFNLQPPRIPYLSNVTGDWITAEQATDPAYWVAHLQQPVQFAAGLAELLRRPHQLLLEIGPGNALGSLAKLHPDCTPAQHPLILPTLPHAYTSQPARPFLLQTLAKLWLTGVAVNWEGFYRLEKRRRLPLPTYPFERQRYWRRVSMPPELSSGTNGIAHGHAPDESPIEVLLAQEPPKLADLTQWGYVASWQRTVPPPSPYLGQRPLPDHRWLVFADECGLADRLVTDLRAQQQPVVVVRSGGRFSYLGRSEYMIRPNQASDYQKLLQALHKQGEMPTKIAHLWSVTAANTAVTLPETLDHGFYSLLFLAQAMGNLSSAPCQLAIISSDMQDVTTAVHMQPAKATVLGPYKVIPQELPHIRCCSIDIPSPTPGSPQTVELASRLLAELVTDLPAAIIAWRDDSRWVQRYEPAPILSADEQAQRLRSGGVYLITGGLGGIGLALARWLVAHFQAKLVLLGRSPLPPRQEWAQILAQQGSESGLGYKIHQIQQLEAMGADVLVLAADVTDVAQMQTAVSQAHARFGVINGVFHTAGVPPLGLILRKEAAAATAVLAPKVQGTLVLHDLFQERDLDFMLLFSSISAVTGGGPGQIDYCAANAFVDAFARRHARHHGLTLAVGWGEWLWDAWQAGLEGFDPGTRAYFQARRKRFGISFAEGFEIIRRLLAHRLPHVVVSTQEFQRVAAGFSTETISHHHRGQENKTKYARPALGTPYAAPATDLEKQIAAIWSDLLGVDAVGAQDNFFELGGNSLIGVDLVTRLRQESGIDTIPLNMLYEAPTIGQMAAQLQTDQPQEDTSEQRLARGQMRRQRALERRR
ncbi:MAG: SDR family NAD(P)-dependent oxidoreductase [Anaerolineae bacterium]|nr:SDR family NAD(P)-dependent oxidoreductase [Anaerolineae bacterium]